MAKATNKLVNNLFRKCLEKVYTDYYSKDNGNIPMEMTFDEYAQTVPKHTLRGQVISNLIDRYNTKITDIPFEEYVIRLIEESKKFDERR